MRFSAVAVVCAAPLALASSLQHDLVARGALKAERSNGNSHNGNAKANNNGKNINGRGNVLINRAAAAPEVIIIWVNGGGAAPTTTLNNPAVPAATAAHGTAAAAAAQVTHEVTVGGTTLTYQPDTIVANVGDMVVFTFKEENHTVTQAAFDPPCVPLAGGMNSGFMPNPNNSVSPAPQIAMQVKVATPLWFYCQQVGHCGKGMVFSINPNNATTGGNKTQAAFQALAIAKNGTGSTATIAGGAAASGSAAAKAPPAAATGTMVNGTGTTAQGNVCTCQCLCGAAAFPQANVQGIGMIGGIGGAIPLSALDNNSS